MSTILAIDTSTEFASVALLRGDMIVCRNIDGVQKHSASLLPTIAELMRDNGCHWNDCDAIAFSAGPGSFTGLRTACGVAQGLGYGVGLPLIAVSTLETIAEGWRRSAANAVTGGTQAAAMVDVVALLDARMNDIYFARFHFDGRRWQIRGEPVMAPATRLYDQFVENSADDDLFAQAVICGNGLDVMQAINRSDEALSDLQRYPRTQPHATALAFIAQTMLADGETLAAENAMPVYVRNHVADTIIEREQAAMRLAQKSNAVTEAAS